MNKEHTDIFNDIDFLIPVYIEHEDRIRNLKILTKYLKALGCTNIFVNEYYRDAPRVQNIVSGYISKDITTYDFYNKMVCGNELYDEYSYSNVVCLCDSDALISKKDFIDCYKKLIYSDFDFAYPYNGKFYDIPKDIVEKLDADFSTPINVDDCKFFAPASHGGCVMFKKEVFKQGGKLNPNFKNVGYDDDEINIRYLKLGYKKYRSNSPLMHMTHFRGNTSYNFSKYVDHNARECGKVNSMSVEELQAYIKSWNANS